MQSLPEGFDLNRAWSHCCEVADLLQSYAAQPLPDMPPALIGHTTDEIRSALQGYSDDSMLASTFAHWRNEVQNIEGRNAGRLTVLVGTLRSLWAMAERLPVDDPKWADFTRAVADLTCVIEQHIRYHYRTEYPPSANERTWPVGVTRDLRLLPAEWRLLSAERKAPRRDREPTRAFGGKS